MATNYTTKTAALKATKADINKLDAKKMLLNGKNILDYISDSEFNSYDTRDPQLKNDELDIWNTAISLSEEGHIEVKPLEHTKDTISSTQSTTIKSAVKVIDNEILGTDDAHIMYWQTDGLTDGTGMFRYCENLETFSSDLPSLAYGTYMFMGCTNLNSFSSDLSSLKFGAYMFFSTNLSDFSSNLPKLMNGDYMFSGCSELTTFSSDLSSLTNSNYMFSDCFNLTSFTSDLSSLTNGDDMFLYCDKLESFTSDLSSLTYGNSMFNGTNLTSFSYDLSKLMYGQSMFGGCTNLNSFSSDLSSLTDGNTMFLGCENLTSFSSGLSSLTLGLGMFNKCKLDAQSVANIVHTLPTHESNGTIYIGIGCDDTEADQLLFAQECDCETWQELLGDFSAKNWTVEFQCNGRPTTTYNMRRGETLPIYAKLEEVIMPTDEKERKPHYAYTSADGSKFFNINYFHSTNGSTEGYDVFSSLEEAISTYNVTPKN